MIDSTRTPPRAATVLLLAALGLLGALALTAFAVVSAGDAPATVDPQSGRAAALDRPTGPDPAPVASGSPPAASSLSAADGLLPEGVTAFSEGYPGLSELRPELLAALRAATTDASAVGLDLQVNSGWRSVAYQEQLLGDAIAQYGSAEEAARWVAAPSASAHVSGDAVDIGPAEAAAWLSQYGAAYGLCQIYENEPWHFELRPDAPAAGCPGRYADAAQTG